jgi:hypothetical protein
MVSISTGLVPELAFYSSTGVAEIPQEIQYLANELNFLFVFF